MSTEAPAQQSRRNLVLGLSAVGLIRLATDRRRYGASPGPNDAQIKKTMIERILNRRIGTNNQLVAPDHNNPGTWLIWFDTSEPNLVSTRKLGSERSSRMGKPR